MQISPLSSFVLTFYQSGGLPNRKLSTFQTGTAVHTAGSCLLVREGCS